MDASLVHVIAVEGDIELTVVNGGLTGDVLYHFCYPVGEEDAPGLYANNGGILEI